MVAPEVGAPRVPPGEPLGSLALARRVVLGGGAYYCGGGHCRFPFLDSPVTQLGPSFVALFSRRARVASGALAGVITEVPVDLARVALVVVSRAFQRRLWLSASVLHPASYAGFLKG